MTIFGRILYATPLAGILLLAACGGGGSSTPAMTSVQAGTQGVAVGEPSPNAKLDTTAFVTAARNEPCAATKNRLFVIDQKYVFWDRAGKCADNAYAQTLYGATVDKQLCSQSDSIMGPRSSCADESARSLFDTLVKNHEAAGLGLGSGHVIEEVKF
jgi:hypothetical protein